MVKRLAVGLLLVGLVAGLGRVAVAFPPDPFPLTGNEPRCVRVTDSWIEDVQYYSEPYDRNHVNYYKTWTEVKVVCEFCIIPLPYPPYFRYDTLYPRCTTTRKVRTSKLTTHHWLPCW